MTKLFGRILVTLTLLVALALGLAVLPASAGLGRQNSQYQMYMFGHLDGIYQVYRPIVLVALGEEKAMAFDQAVKEINNLISARGPLLSPQEQGKKGLVIHEAMEKLRRDFITPATQEVRLLVQACDEGLLGRQPYKPQKR